MTTMSRTRTLSARAPEPRRFPVAYRMGRLFRFHWLVLVALVVGLGGGYAAHSDANLRAQIETLRADLERSAAGNADLRRQIADVRATNDRLTAELKAKDLLPNLVGKSRDDMQTIADNYGWKLGTIKERESTKRVGTVLSQSPKAGTLMSLGKTFTVVVAKPPPMPNLVGQREKDARAIAKRYGWMLLPVEQVFSSQPKGTVLQQSPKPGTRLGEGPLASFAIVVSTGCDSNYAGACLNPIAVDYDCAGGTGDGPLYTGFVRVTGSDHYDLDRDNDGLGCE